MLEFGLMASLAVSVAAGGAVADDFFGTDFEKFTGIPADAAVPLDDGELDELRGGTNSALLVSVEEYSSWSPQNNGLSGAGDQSDGRFQVEDSGSAVQVTDTETGNTILAEIGDNAFNGAHMLSLISQVPGNGNEITQVMVVNIAIFQVTEAELPSAVDSWQNSASAIADYSVFGF